MEKNVAKNVRFFFDHWQQNRRWVRTAASLWSRDMAALLLESMAGVEETKLAAEKEACSICLDAAIINGRLRATRWFAKCAPARTKLRIWVAASDVRCAARN